MSLTRIFNIINMISIISITNTIHRYIIQHDFQDKNVPLINIINVIKITINITNIKSISV